jgi:hypothetical protein
MVWPMLHVSRSLIGVSHGPPPKGGRVAYVLPSVHLSVSLSVRNTSLRRYVQPVLLDPVVQVRRVGPILPGHIRLR